METAENWFCPAQPRGFLIFDTFLTGKRARTSRRNKEINGRGWINTNKTERIPRVGVTDGGGPEQK
jgi:hypothetical protein